MIPNDTLIAWEKNAREGAYTSVHYVSDRLLEAVAEIARLQADVERLTREREEAKESGQTLFRALQKLEAVVRAAGANPPLAERLADLLLTEDLEDEALRDAAETLLPQIHDFFLRLNDALAAYRGRA